MVAPQQEKPDKRVIFINYSAVDPNFTNDKCNFWHFRFDANADIKMDAITDVIAQVPSIKKMYLIDRTTHLVRQLQLLQKSIWQRKLR